MKISGLLSFYSGIKKFNSDLINSKNERVL